MDGMTMEAVWLNEGQTCSFLALIEASGLTGEEVQWLMESGALMPLPAAQAESQPQPQESLSFPAAALPVAMLARRLRDDFELDRAGLALALRLMQRIDTLEQEIERLRARLPARSHPA
ncbi:chaperone modulator CbpM [Noviherbaspirillum soli]|uniref:chaperone modulator CbpM n=1 Tax=Noviherbaspirillum soli TaxID=1064518 RepID=UPI00188B072D|nr:chaperone modulator CbpM [Noviherbaspirillum soli]